MITITLGAAKMVTNTLGAAMRTNTLDAAVITNTLGAAMISNTLGAAMITNTSHAKTLLIKWSWKSAENDGSINLNKYFGQAADNF